MESQELKTWTKILDFKVGNKVRALSGPYYYNPREIGPHMNRGDIGIIIEIWYQEVGDIFLVRFSKKVKFWLCRNEIELVG